MKPVFLVGYMGCGKSTVGRELALQLNMAFIDLDEYIEQEQQQSIAQIFDRQGEAAFRQLEAAALRQVATMSDVVVACGGGTPCHGGNMAVMNEKGITVWLVTTPRRMTARLLLPQEKCRRPKVSDMPDAEVLPLVQRELQERAAHYGQAQLRFDSTDIETAAATRRTTARLAARLQSLPDFSPAP